MSKLFRHKKKIKHAEKLLESANMYADIANTSVSASVLFASLKKVLDSLEELSQYEKYKFFPDSSPTDDFNKIVSNVGAIVDNLIDRALGKIEESPYYTYEVNRLRAEFLLSALSEMSTDSSVWKSSIDSSRKPIKLYTTANRIRVTSLYNDLCKKEHRRAFIAKSSSWDYIDGMDGASFEVWCADLLSKIGFKNVRVSGKSGDQGVDILAEKESIKYAIQCKCYHSDLGNTPIQEVYAGKMFYNCHVGAVMTNRHFTDGGRELAGSTGVLLWDRNWIQKKLQEVDPDTANQGNDIASITWRDDMLPMAVDVVLETGQASVSMLHRRLKLGYARAARIVDEMEELGIVGPFRGSAPRFILISKEDWVAIRNKLK